MKLALIVVLAALVACGTEGEPSLGPFEGVWTGAYTIDTTITQAELQLSQSDDQVLGTLTVDGREASLNGTVSGNRLEATWSYLDQCGGEATTVADLVAADLVGTYDATDCDGSRSGEYVLTKQE